MTELEMWLTRSMIWEKVQRMIYSKGKVLGKA